MTIQFPSAHGARFVPQSTAVDRKDSAQQQAKERVGESKSILFEPASASQVQAQQMQSLKAQAAKIQERRDAIKKMDMPQAEKEEMLETLDESLEQVEQQMAQLRAQRQELEDWKAQPQEGAALEGENAAQVTLSAGAMASLAAAQSKQAVANGQSEAALQLRALARQEAARGNLAGAAPGAAAQAAALSAQADTAQLGALASLVEAAQAASGMEAAAAEDAQNKEEPSASPRQEPVGYGPDGSPLMPEQEAQVDERI